MRTRAGLGKRSSTARSMSGSSRTCANAKGSRAASSRPDNKQSLQIFSLGKLERHRMVGGGAEAFDDLGVGSGVECGAGDDRLEELRRDPARAGEGRKQPARGEQLEGEQVDVL